jgi:hypothetical protein
MLRCKDNLIYLYHRNDDEIASTDDIVGNDPIHSTNSWFCKLQFSSIYIYIQECRLVIKFHRIFHIYFSVYLPIIQKKMDYVKIISNEIRIHARNVSVQNNKI